MMQIYRILFFLFLQFYALVCPLWADQPNNIAVLKDVENFLYQHGCNGTQLQNLFEAGTSTEFQTENFFLSFEIASITNLNPLVRNSLQKSIKLKSHNHLCKYLFENLKNIPYRYRDIVFDIYMNEAIANMQYRIAGIEFVSGIYQDKIFAISTFSKEKIKDIQERVQSNEFRKKYCEYLSCTIKKSYTRSPDNALSLLEELSKLKWHELELTVINCEILQKQGRNSEAILLADKILLNNSNKLGSDLAERLGDVFFNIGEEEKALKCYKLVLGTGVNL